MNFLSLFLTNKSTKIYLFKTFNWISKRFKPEWRNGLRDDTSLSELEQPPKRFGAGLGRVDDCPDTLKDTSTRILLNDRAPSGKNKMLNFFVFWIPISFENTQVFWVFWGFLFRKHCSLEGEYKRGENNGLLSK